MKIAISALALLLVMSPASAIVTNETAIAKKACMIQIGDNAFINGNTVTTAKVSWKNDVDKLNYYVEFSTLNGSAYKLFPTTKQPELVRDECDEKAKKQNVQTCYKPAPKAEWDVWNAQLEPLKKAADDYLRVKVAEIQKCK